MKTAILATLAFLCCVPHHSSAQEKVSGKAYICKISSVEFTDSEITYSMQVFNPKSDTGTYKITIKEGLLYRVDLDFPFLTFAPPGRQHFYDLGDGEIGVASKEVRLVLKLDESRGQYPLPEKARIESTGQVIFFMYSF